MRTKRGRGEMKGGVRRGRDEMREGGKGVGRDVEGAK